MKSLCTALPIKLAGVLVAGGALASTESRNVGQLRPAKSIQPKIVNGITTVGFPAVALLRTEGGHCSATLIGCRTVLTAAHCFCPETPGFLCDPEPSAVTGIFLQHAPEPKVAAVSVHPDWSPAERNRHDLALVRLASPVSGVAPIPINAVGRPRHGTQGVIVGYGITQGDQTNSGIKRSGLVTTARCLEADSNTQVCWNFEYLIGPPGQDSNTCRGDSGGPLLLADGTGGTVVGGVTSFGSNPFCLPPDNSKNADVFVDRSWIAEVAGTDLERTTCGSLPAAGSARAPVSFAEGVLDETNDGDIWTFEVEPGTDLLRIALNAERPHGIELGGNDFDILARHGAPPTTLETADCVSVTELALELCEVDSPEPGQWYVEVQHFGGAGLYQLTVTQFLAADAPGPIPCIGRAESLMLHERFLVSGEAFLAGNPSDFFLQSLCRPDGVSPMALGFYFNATGEPRLEGFISITDNCDRAAQTFKVEVASASTRKFTVAVVDTLTGLTAAYSNPNPGRSAFFPVDLESFADSCEYPNP